MKTLDDAQAMNLAIERAQKFRGATAPNPPVGAVLRNKKGEVIGVGAHERAGKSHAEVLALEDAKNRGKISEIYSLTVTLEPCHHIGRTPPCTRSILAAEIKKIIYGARDPNPKVKGGGLQFLRDHGVEIVGPTEEESCAELIRPFKKHILTGLPWVTVKVAQTEKGSMIPPTGQKTFSSESSLKLAHELRKRSNAILSGSETILKDSPLFTVRHIADHSDHAFPRKVVIMDRRGRLPESWKKEAEARGLEVITEKGPLDEVLLRLGREGCLEVLVEAGPTLLRTIRRENLWDEEWRITVREGEPDRVERFLRI